MKFTGKILSLLLALVVLFGAAGFSSTEILVAKSVAASTKTVAFKKKTVKLKTVTTTVNGPKVTWNKLTGTNKYYVYRKTSSTSWKKIATVKNTVASYTDKDVKNKTAKYFYTVKGVDKKGVLSQYNKTGLAIYFVKSPVLGNITQDSKNNIKISWTKVNNATGYYIYRKKADGDYGKIATVKSGKTVSYTDKSSKKTNTKYTYTVKAYKTVSGKTHSSAYYTKGLVITLKANVVQEATNPVVKDPIAAYQKAAKEIHDRGIAGYKIKGWQTLEGALETSNGYFGDILTDIMECFLTAPDEAEVKDNVKGSDDAKTRMPVSDCSAEYIKSATVVTKGNNYVITIVLKDQVNPSYDDKDGLALMSRGFLDMKDVVKVVENDSTVSSVVKEVDGTITYKDYTITATMDKNGKFIKIVHHGIGYINGEVSVLSSSSTGVTGAISFNCEYYDFEY